MFYRQREDKYEESMGQVEDNNNRPLDKPLNLETEKQRDRRPSQTDKESGPFTHSYHP